MFYLNCEIRNFSQKQVDFSRIKCLFSKKAMHQITLKGRIRYMTLLPLELWYNRRDRVKVPIDFIHPFKEL